MASFRKGPVMKLQFLLVCVLLETGLSSVRASEILRSVNQVFVNCTLETFECAGDKKCLPKKFLCDGINHCADHSDETGCLKHVCDPTEFFQCKYNFSQGQLYSFLSAHKLTQDIHLSFVFPNT